MMHIDDGRGSERLTPSFWSQLADGHQRRPTEQIHPPPSAARQIKISLALNTGILLNKAPPLLPLRQNYRHPSFKFSTLFPGQLSKPYIVFVSATRGSL